MVAKFTYPAAKKMKVTLMLCLWDRSVLSLQSRHRMGGSQRSALRDFPNVWSVVSNWRYRPLADLGIHRSEGRLGAHSGSIKSPLRAHANRILLRLLNLLFAM
jgi:hypothetical protein